MSLAVNDELIIGTDYDHTPQFYGRIDDVRLFDAPLTRGQIRRIYGAGLGSKLALAEHYGESA